MKLYASLVLFILAFVTLTSAQEVQRNSLLSALSERGVLVSAEGIPDPALLPGFETTQEHALELSNTDGSSTPLWLWLAQKEGQDYVPYISLAYEGALNEASAQAFGYLYGFTATACMGFEMEEVNAINEFVFGFLPTLTEYWLSKTKQFGEVNLTIGGQVRGETLTLFVDYEHLGTPDTSTWQVACGLE